MNSLGEFDIEIEHGKKAGTMKAVHYNIPDAEIEIIGFRVNGKLTHKKTVTLKANDYAALVVNIRELVNK